MTLTLTKSWWALFALHISSILLLQAHSHNLDEKCVETVVEVNKAIGTEICTDTHDMIVVSSTSLFITDGQQVTDNASKSQQMENIIRLSCHGIFEITSVG